MDFVHPQYENNMFVISKRELTEVVLDIDPPHVHPKVPNSNSYRGAAPKAAERGEIV